MTTLTDPTTDTTALADLEQDLDRELPCENIYGCDHTAVERCSAIHQLEGNACWTFLMCACCAAHQKAVIARVLAQGGYFTCDSHSRLVDVRWQPLRPGRR